MAFLRASIRIVLLFTTLRYVLCMLHWNSFKWLNAENIVFATSPYNVSMCAKGRKWVTTQKCSVITRTMYYSHHPTLPDLKIASHRRKHNRSKEKREKWCVDIKNGRHSVVGLGSIRLGECIWQNYHSVVISVNWILYCKCTPNTSLWFFGHFVKHTY